MPSDTIYVLSVAYFFMHIFMLLDEQLCGRIPRPDSVSAWAAQANNFNIIHLNLFGLILKSVSHAWQTHTHTRRQGQPDGQLTVGYGKYIAALASLALSLTVSLTVSHSDGCCCRCCCCCCICNYISATFCSKCSFNFWRPCSKCFLVISQSVAPIAASVLPPPPPSRYAHPLE